VVVHWPYGLCPLLWAVHKQALHKNVIWNDREIVECRVYVYPN
jgi:hypothetical protein